MKKVGLTVYGFSILDNMNQRFELHNVLGKDVINIILDYANNNCKKYKSDDKDEVVFKIENTQAIKKVNTSGQEVYSLLYGRVKTGAYGIESELVDSTTGDVTHNRTRNEADVMPFVFCIAVPAGNVNNGIIILQSIGLYGMKTILHKKLNEHFKSINKDLTFHMGNIIPKTYLKRLIDDGVLQRLRLIKYDIPQDLSDRLGINYGIEETIQEMVIRKPSGFLENKKKELNEWMNGSRRYDQLIQIDDFDYDDLKLEFKLGRTTKTISLKNIDNVVIAEDITDDVKDDGGHPSYDSLIPIMQEYAEDYLAAKGLLVLE